MTVLTGYVRGLLMTSNVSAILDVLSHDEGVMTTRLLSKDEKNRILNKEQEAEDRIIFGMCKSLNEGVRDAINSEYTVALIIDTSIFRYPHHPHMSIMWKDQVVGEQVSDDEKIKTLKKDRFNFFLWDTFVIYMKKLPKAPKDRDQIRFVYRSRVPLQLKGFSFVCNPVFGTPSTECDLLIKDMLCIEAKDAVIGTCLIGFDLA
jgi:hypothetical protein